MGNAAPSGLINYGSTWKYLDNNTRPAGWETIAFNDVAWSSGLSELGYGDGGEATCVASGVEGHYAHQPGTSILPLISGKHLT